MLQLLLQSPLLFVVVLLAIVVALSVHEFSHAYVGNRLGDPTAALMGRLTLNPLAHIDPFGMLMLVLIGFGWGKPVPFDPCYLKNRSWGPVWIALAGPGSNLVLALVSAVLVRGLLATEVFAATNALIVFLSFSVVINLLLMFFNLLPLPPLDGSKVLYRILDAPKYDSVRDWLETRGSWILIGVIVADAFLNLGIFSSLFSWVYGLAFFLVGSL